jgi:plastocyanin
MKENPMHRLPIVTVLALSLLWLAGPAVSQAGHEHMHGESAAAPATPAATGVAEAWAELRGARDAIAGDIEAGRLKEIHAKSERLAPLAKALVERSADLAADKRTRVEAAVKQLPRVADSLHEAADKGDAAATRRELGRLDGLLELIRAQYPADALAAPAAQHGGHSQAHQHAASPLAQVETPAQATLRVQASEFDFQPRTLSLRAGVPTRIELANDGATEHSLVVKAPGGASDWIHLHAGPKQVDAGTYRIDTPGEYPLLCTIAGHTEAGMVGLVVVRK